MRTGLATDIQRRNGHYVWMILTHNRYDVLRRGRTSTLQAAKAAVKIARAEVLKERAKK